MREVRIAVRLQVVGAADPGVGHDGAAAAGLHGRGSDVADAAALDAVEGVVGRQLMAHLVRHVVDGEQVADRLRDAGAAAGLEVVAGHADVRDSAAVQAHAEMADVVVGGADQLPDHGPRPVERRNVATGGVRSRVARGGAARAVGSCHLRRGVQVEQVVARDEAQVDREIVLVDLVDAVDEDHLGRGDVGGAVVGRVRRIAHQREAIRAQPHGLAVLGGRGGYRLAPGGRRHDVVLAEATARGQVGAAVADVQALIGVVVGVDVPGSGRPADGRVQAERGQVEVDGRAGVVDARAAVGRDLRVRGGQGGLHQRRLLHGEAPEAPVRGGQGDRQRRAAGPGRALARRRGEHARERRAVHDQCAEALRADLPSRAVVRGGGGAGDVAPGCGRSRGRGRHRGRRGRRGGAGEQDREHEAPQRTRRPHPGNPRRGGRRPRPGTPRRGPRSHPRRLDWHRRRLLSRSRMDRPPRKHKSGEGTRRRTSMLPREG
ncbi:MAG: hypothetical protein QOJ63_2664 [Solirubrobacteraceae bacterium]|jgi:hypothetical protein|nr:hypothetical protein [Solirubrobacteraceae bacterium]